MTDDLDGYIRKLTTQAARDVDRQLEELIIKAFGSVEAFMLLKDDFVLEVHDSFPTITESQDKNTTAFRIESYYRLRRKTPEERSGGTNQDS